MDASSIQIAGTELAGATWAAGQVRVQLARALIVKTMTGSVEQTLWWQAGALVIGGVEEEPPAEGLDQLQGAICERGDIDDNEYTYRNMIPIPLRSRGRIGLELHLRDGRQPLRVRGATIELKLRDTPKYIEHVRPG